MRYLHFSLLICCGLIISCFAHGQTTKDSSFTNATITNCVQYALKHQPLIQQSIIDEDITERQIQTRLSAWYPQVNFGYNFQHNFQLPVAYSEGTYITTGTFNSSNIGLGATQAIFSQDLLLASRTANDVRKQARQTTTSNKIDISVNVSKAFYDVLFTEKQAEVLAQDTIRLVKSLKDAYNQYEGGLVDKTDYKRATISLNNTRAQLKQTYALIAAKYTYLKQLMGYPQNDSLDLQYDTTQMETVAIIDTNQLINYQDRIEYQQLETEQRLLQSNLKYYKWSFLPTVSAYGNYNLGYLNNDFSQTYSQSYPNSDIGLSLSVPIFQGNKRIQEVREAELQLDRLNWDFTSLKDNINTEYQQALAVYKGNLADYLALKDNVQLANDVYNVIDLQYRSGVKTYLDVIVAESDLRSAQLNYYNALYQLLQSKLDVEKALGTVQY
jgi:outer membrane protein